MAQRSAVPRAVPWDRLEQKWVAPWDTLNSEQPVSSVRPWAAHSVAMMADQTVYPRAVSKADHSAAPLDANPA